MACVIICGPQGYRHPLKLWPFVSILVNLIKGSLGTFHSSSQFLHLPQCIAVDLRGHFQVGNLLQSISES